MDLLSDCKKMLEGHNLSDVSRRSGLAYSTVHELARGKRGDVYAGTWKRIKQATEQIERERKKAAK